MNANYSILAEYYDKFTHKDCDYEGWSQYLYELASVHGAREVVDIACGTGKMTQLLVRRGLRLTGVDASVDMLNVARGKCRANFVCQDMRKLVLPHQVDMAICVNDGINYLKGSELAPFFTQVASCIKCGAPFVFDVSSAYKLTKVIANEVFYWDDDGETLLWSNTLNNNSVEMNLTLFVAGSDGLYVRRDERHIQYIHTERDIEQALAQAGLQLIATTAEYGKPLTEQALRITFYAVKK